MASIKKYTGKKGISYNISQSCGYDINGKQIVKRMTWRPEPGMTEAQIKKELDKQVFIFENSCRTGSIPSGIRFQEFAEMWIKEYAKPFLKPNSYGRVIQFRDRVYQQIGHMKIQDITHRDIRNLVNYLVYDAKNKRDKSKHLSQKTVKNYLSFVSSVMRYAMENDIIDSNPCREISVPRTENNAPKEHEFYSMDELCRLYELMKEQNAPLKYQLFFNIAFFCGFRRAEVLGLEWKDINWERNTITVERTSNRSKEKGYYTLDTKTRSSQRVGSYNDELFRMLGEYKAQQDKKKNQLGTKWEENDRLFTQWDGKPMNPNTPYSWLRDFCKDNGLRFCNVHSFRHSHASGLIASGLDVPTVAADLGHGNNITTISVYAHEFRLAQAKPRKVLEEGMEAARKRLREKEKPAEEDTPARLVKVRRKQAKKS